MIGKKVFWVGLILMGVLVGGAFFFRVEGNVLASKKTESRQLDKVIQSQEIIISRLDNLQYAPAVVYNWKHNEYLVVWENVWPGGSHDIYAQRISDEGNLLSWFAVSDGAISTANRMQPDVAYDPVEDRYLVVWVSTVGSDQDVIGRFIPWQGPDPALTDFRVSSYIGDEWKPKVAFARGQVPMEFMVVWMNAPSGSDRWIGYSRVLADGSNTNPSNFSVSQGVGDRDFPDITYNRSNNTFLVVWDFINTSNGTGIDIFGRRFHGNGAAIGSEFGIASWPDDEEHPSVAVCAESNQFLVAWQSLRNPLNYDIYARYISGDGIVGSLPSIDDVTTVSEIEPDVSCNMSGNQYFLTWQQQYSNTSGPYGITGKVIYPNQTVEEAFAISGPYQGVAADYQSNPAVAGGYHNYLTAWEQDRSGTVYQDIYGRLFTPNAVFLPFIIR